MAPNRERLRRTIGAVDPRPPAAPPQLLATARETSLVGEGAGPAGRYRILAARWAAKEAVAKAFKTGIGDVAFREIEILHGPRSEPVLRLHGAAERLAQEHGLTVWSISLSHTETHAIAFVTAMGPAEK